jgi:hypothetical protein
MIPAGYKEALVTYAQTKGALGLAELSDEFDALFALSRKNKGLEVVNSQVNGKTFGFVVNMTVEEKFAVIGEALRELSGDRVVQTSPDFRQYCR